MSILYSDKPLIYVVDDDHGVRSSLNDLLTSVGYEVVSYESPRDFLVRQKVDRLSCLVLDVRLQGVNGLDVQEQLRAERPVLPVILVSGHGDVPMTVRGMRAGAIDFLEKPFREQALLDAVALAIEEARRKRPMIERRREAEDRFARLSPREREVIGHVIKGQLSKQIARLLSISEVTVKIHRASAMRKLGVRSLVELTRLAETMGI
jgi:FixJ family two-component response regulator